MNWDLKKIVIFICTLAVPTFIYSQNYFKNSIDLSFDVGFSNDLASPEKYKTISTIEDLIVNRTSLARVSSWSISFTRFIDPKNGIKFSFGEHQFGFYFDGILEVSRIPVNERQLFSSKEWGLSYVRRIPILTDANLVFEPGLRFHSDFTIESFTLSFFNKNSFSFSTFMGVELPLVQDIFFVNAGLQIKMPLEKYNYTFGNEEPYYPFFFGIKLGLTNVIYV